eukprot:5553340-Pyramimonas_sp.AAC.1
MVISPEGRSRIVTPWVRNPRVEMQRVGRGPRGVGSKMATRRSLTELSRGLHVLGTDGSAGEGARMRIMASETDDQEEDGGRRRRIRGSRGKYSRCPPHRHKFLQG